jgi:hypothetical protein
VQTRNAAAAPETESGITWTHYATSSSGATTIIDGMKAGFFGFLPGGVSVDVAVRSVNEHGVSQGVSSAVSDTEVIDEFPIGYFTVSPTPGLANFSTVTSALNALPANGGQITLLEGTHVLSSSVTMPDKAVDVIGINRDNVIVQNKIGQDGFVMNEVSKQYRYSNFSMESQNTTEGAFSFMFSIVGSAWGNNASNVTVENIDFDITGKGTPDDAALGTGGDIAIYSLYNSGRLIVNGVECDGKGHAGIYLSYCGHATLQNSRVSGSQVFGINVRPKAGWAGQGSDIRVTSNTIEKWRTNGIYIVSGSSAVTLVDNTISMNSGCTWPDPVQDTARGIYFNTGVGTVVNNQIVMDSDIGHDIAAGNFYGIIATCSEKGIIKGNSVISGCSVNSIASALSIANPTVDTVISNNSIKWINTDYDPNGSYAIYHVGDRCIISDNSIVMGNDASDVGIYLAAGADNNAGDNNLTYNVGDALADNGAGNVVAEPKDV